MSLDDFETRVKRHLESGVDNIDDATKKRLHTIRHEALNQPVKYGWFSAQQWMPAATLAFCSVIALMLFLPSPNESNGSIPLEQMAVLELMGNPEEADVLSDPGFYIWLDEIESHIDNA